MCSFKHTNRCRLFRKGIVLALLPVMILALFSWFRIGSLDVFAANNVGGELIFVDEGTTLTVNGASTDEEKRTEHPSIPMFYSPNDGKTTGKESVYGGSLTGGNGSYGTGGIYINSGKAS